MSGIKTPYSVPVNNDIQNFGTQLVSINSDGWTKTNIFTNRGSLNLDNLTENMVSGTLSGSNNTSQGWHGVKIKIDAGVTVNLQAFRLLRQNYYSGSDFGVKIFRITNGWQEIASVPWSTLSTLGGITENIDYIFPVPLILGGESYAVEYYFLRRNEGGFSAVSDNFPKTGGVEYVNGAFDVDILNGQASSTPSYPVMFGLFKYNTIYDKCLSGTALSPLYSKDEALKYLKGSFEYDTPENTALSIDIEDNSGTKLVTDFTEDDDLSNLNLKELRIRVNMSRTSTSVDTPQFNGGSLLYSTLALLKTGIVVMQDYVPFCKHFSNLPEGVILDITGECYLATCLIFYSGEGYLNIEIDGKLLKFRSSSVVEIVGLMTPRTKLAGTGDNYGTMYVHFYNCNIHKSGDQAKFVDYTEDKSYRDGIILSPQILYAKKKLRIWTESVKVTYARVEGGVKL